MRAVFEADKPYMQIARDEVLNAYPAYSEPGEYYSGSGIKVTVDRELIGSRTGITSKSSFIFSEGEKHNRLTLTDPTEIAGMRACIKAREYIREISCEDE